MKQKTAIFSLILFIVLLVGAVVLLYSYYLFLDSQNSYDSNSSITISNWNMQIFGDKKASDVRLMENYGETISHFDIIFLQELRDQDASSFKTLCAELPDYNCNISSRAGRSSSKEQYGIIYLKKFSLDRLIDYNLDNNSRSIWERPPIRIDFSLGNYSFTVYNIHTKPNETVKELKSLETLVGSESNNRNVVVLGDLNADCYYYNPYSENMFSNWYWIIKSSDDTTTGPSDCAYDRILLNGDMYNEYLNYGIYTEDIDGNISDHYPVWVRIRNSDETRDLSFSAFLKSIL